MKLYLPSIQCLVGADCIHTAKSKKKAMEGNCPLALKCHVDVALGDGGSGQGGGGLPVGLDDLRGLFQPR